MVVPMFMRGSHVPMALLLSDASVERRRYDDSTEAIQSVAPSESFASVALLRTCMMKGAAKAGFSAFAYGGSRPIPLPLLALPVEIGFRERERSGEG